MTGSVPVPESISLFDDDRERVRTVRTSCLLLESTVMRVRVVRLVRMPQTSGPRALQLYDSHTNDKVILYTSTYEGSTQKKC